VFTVLRYYHGNAQLAAELVKYRTDIEGLMRQVNGFVSYQMIQAPEATVSITTCETREACEETSRKAAEFLKAHASDIKAGAPQILGGDVRLDFRSGKPAMA
jgi:hypothetical protein